jgi:hypothetical protein
MVFILDTVRTFFYRLLSWEKSTKIELAKNQLKSVKLNEAKVSKPKTLYKMSSSVAQILPRNSLRRRGKRT